MDYHKILSELLSGDVAFTHLDEIVDCCPEIRDRVKRGISYDDLTISIEKLLHIDNDMNCCKILVAMATTREYVNNMISDVDVEGPSKEAIVAWMIALLKERAYDKFLRGTLTGKLDTSLTRAINDTLSNSTDIVELVRKISNGGVDACSTFQIVLDELLTLDGLNLGRVLVALAVVYEYVRTTNREIVVDWCMALIVKRIYVKFGQTGFSDFVKRYNVC